MNYVTLFSSAGVGCYGFKMAGFDCLATNELVEKRLNVQKLNNKCKNDGYILGDLTKEETKQRLLAKIDKEVDVVVATPPCQGMSVANHNKKPNEIERNSLVVESVRMIKVIKPKFFVIENVPLFWKTGCTINNEVKPIGEMILSELSDYNIAHQILNFKNYGANSSRKRTLVIGVRKDLNLDPTDFYPNEQKEKTLYEVIGHLPTLKEFGEYDKEDFYHSFRPYESYIREFITPIQQGKTAFENKTVKLFKFVNSEKIEIKQAVADKYKRQSYDKVATCVLTRSDLLGSQNTIHPIDDRVFSIRELMEMMTIPKDFKWIDKTLDELNALSDEEKRKVSKKEELNIRRSIGEAVPTEIFRQIAEKIKDYLNK